MFSEDLYVPKAHAVARNIEAHATSRCTITAHATGFDETFLDDAPSCLVAGVDNNEVRLRTAAYALRVRVPAVFVMLALDGQRAQVFLQRPDGPCLSCVLPNLDVGERAPCAAASIASCFMAASHSLQMVLSALDGRPVPPWRETSLDGTADRIGAPRRQSTCNACRVSSSSSVPILDCPPPMK
jgi:hypothetical protein